MKIDNQSFLEAGSSLEIMGNVIKNCIDNIKRDMEILGNKMELVSSVRLEKSCQHVTKVGNHCLGMSDIAYDIGNAYDDALTEQVGRSK